MGKFFVYSNNAAIIQIANPDCIFPEYGDECFLVYTDDEEAAFRLAMRHIYDGLPFSKFFGDYDGEHYFGVKCVM